mmetsp:Transcript_123088/g.342826  ORF Transcript_123088/g.342826 Transcript_123088/m.342826 type:complete len:345 (+) Transcript_123088:97-1131(+)
MCQPGKPHKMAWARLAVAAAALAALAWPAGASRPPRRSLLGVRTDLHHAASGALRLPRPADFFTEDAEGMDELPNSPPLPRPNASRQCHPKCVWDCGFPSCNTNCRPMCQPPKCVTKCRKLLSSQCRNTCQEPQCAVVCPPNSSQPCSEGGNCPECSTVCGKPHCSLDCGRQACESSCQDPICTWSCALLPCPKPECKLHCETPECSHSWIRTLRVTLHDVYAGRGGEAEEAPAAVTLRDHELAARGIASLPPEHLDALRRALIPEVGNLPGVLRPQQQPEQQKEEGEPQKEEEEQAVPSGTLTSTLGPGSLPPLTASPPLAPAPPPAPPAAVVPFSPAPAPPW